LADSLCRIQLLDQELSPLNRATFVTPTVQCPIVTYVMAANKGEWKIEHEHESEPFYLDGGFKAAIDLTP
jgi:hypothetical protein